MALQLGALRDALLDAGAAPDKADKAAEELAGYDTDIALLKWATGANLSLILLGSMFAIWSKLGDIAGQLAQLSARIPG